MTGSGHKHLLSIQDLGADGIAEVLRLTDSFVEVSSRAIPKVPALRGKTVVSMFFEDSMSDEYGFEFDGTYSLGNRPIEVIGVPPGRGVDPSAKPPMLLEAEHHALTFAPGVGVGGIGEDIR